MSKFHFNKIMWTYKFRRQKPPEVSRNEFLRKLPFFSNLSDKQLKKLARYLHQRQFEEDEYLFEGNHPGGALYMVSRGLVAIETSGDKKNRIELARIQSGEFLGEMALLDGSPRSASARALTPTQTYALFRGDLNKLSKLEPEIACEIYKALAWIVGERLKATNRRVVVNRKAA